MSDSLWPNGLQPTRQSVHGILQARILKWVAIPFSKGSSLPRDRTWISCISGDTLPCMHLYHPKQELKYFHHPWNFHLSFYTFILSFHPQAITFQFLSLCSLIPKSHPTLVTPWTVVPLSRGASVHGIPQARILDGFLSMESFIHGSVQARILDWLPFLLQGIFPTQGSNLGLLHCRRILYYLSHQLSPIIH